MRNRDSIPNEYEAQFQNKNSAMRYKKADQISISIGVFIDRRAQINTPLRTNCQQLQSSDFYS